MRRLALLGGAVLDLEQQLGDAAVPGLGRRERGLVHVGEEGPEKLVVLRLELGQAPRRGDRDAVRRARSRGRAARRARLRHDVKVAGRRGGGGLQGARPAGRGVVGRRGQDFVPGRGQHRVQVAVRQGAVALLQRAVSLEGGVLLSRQGERGGAGRWGAGVGGGGGATTAPTNDQGCRVGGAAAAAADARPAGHDSGRRVPPGPGAAAAAAAVALVPSASATAPQSGVSPGAAAPPPPPRPPTGAGASHPTWRARRTDRARRRRPRPCHPSRGPSWPPARRRPRRRRPRAWRRPRPPRPPPPGPWRGC